MNKGNARHRKTSGRSAVGRLTAALLLVSLLTGCSVTLDLGSGLSERSDGSTLAYENLPESYEEALASIPDYAGEDTIEINGNVPFFQDSDLTEESYEYYSELDSEERCGVAAACIGSDLMPTEKRSSISEVKPSGWQTVRYEGLVEGDYLYNRCHLIGYQLTGENANEKNLITGTRYFNVDGMLPYENEVADYIEQTDNHVLYRVTPLFEGDELVARGVLMEAESVEDAGKGVAFNVFVYNIQPGVTIDYSTGGSTLSTGEDEITVNVEGEADYVLNTSSKKFHLPSCSGVEDIKAENREDYHGDRKMLIAEGYSPCGRCKP